jgi:hypothetical protein
VGRGALRDEGGGANYYCKVSLFLHQGSHFSLYQLLHNTGFPQQVERVTILSRHIDYVTWRVCLNLQGSHFSRPSCLRNEKTGNGISPKHDAVFHLKYA